MQLQIDKLGKVAVTVEQGYWSNEKDYDRLTIVEAPKGEYKTYISRKPVPAGTVLTNREYWIPFSSLKEEIVIDFNAFVVSLTEAMQQTKAYADNTIEQGIEDITAIKEEAMRIITYIADNGIDSTVLAPNSVTSEKIKAGNVLSEHIGAGEVKSVNIGAGEVKSSNIGEGEVKSANIGNGEVKSGNIGAGEVKEGHIAPGAITTEKLDTPVITQLQTIMDDTPTPGSVLPVNSGGVFDSVISSGVFDLSAHTGDSYASLSAALTAMNALPTAYKKGGMSIKYVQSSDNNSVYVQYRLMAQNFTTDVTQWQGVDDEPTAGSENLVKSGGVKEQIQPLSSAINGESEVNIDFSDYDLIGGLIGADGSTFRDASSYGSNNKYILIPFADFRGRKMIYTTASGVYASRFAFLTSNVLTDGAVPPYCKNTTVYNNAVTGNYPIPNDCSYLYVYADRQGTSSLPSSIVISQVEPTVATKEEVADVVEELYAVARNTGYINIHSINNDYNHTYTLENAINSVPSGLRYTAKGIVYLTADTGETGVRIALFNSATYISGWTDASNWIVLNPKDLRNISETIGIYKEVHSDVSSPSGNTTFSDIAVKWDAMKVFVNSIDNNGKWRVLVRYADNTNEFFTLSNGENTIIPSKLTKGFAFVLMTTSASCNIDADVFIGDALLIYSKTPEIDPPIPPTPQSIGAVAVEQGLANAGKVLVVGNDGNVVPGENTPIGILEGYAKIVNSITIPLKADSASEVSVGSGWSGDLVNGYTHTVGNTDSLILGHTTENRRYLVTLEFNSVSETSLEVKIGNGYAVDPYNGTSLSRIGFISDGGDLILLPNSSYNGTVKVKLQEITDAASSVETISLNVYNIDEGQSVDNISGFWNASLGAHGTLIHNQNGTRNIAFGNEALRELISGSRNIGIGTFALCQLKFGKGNIGIGADTYYQRQGGNDNVAIGRACMGGSTETVNNNVCVGRSAGERASGDDNVCIGTLAGHKATSGCVFVGNNTGYSHSGGVNNTFVGRSSGTTGTTKSGGNWNTCIGPSSDFDNNVNKSCAIGYKAYATKSNQVVLGNYSTTANDGTVETLVHGDLVVRGTDGIMRRIVFNSDNTVTWEAVS